jgi:predicted ATPase
MAEPHGDHRQDAQTRAALYGRARELDVLSRALEAACAGHGGLVLIGGETGIGKTTLVRALTDEASQKGAIVHSSACYDFSVTPPYGPWLEIYANMGTNISPPPPPSSSEDQPVEWAPSQDALFNEALSLLTEVAAKHPRLLVLEDFHWVDSASLEFLRYAARQISDIRVLILVTYRDTEIEYGHPFYRHLPTLVRESGATRIRLRPLDEPSIDEMLVQRYQFSVSERTTLLSYLLKRTEGNPFFIGESLRTLEEHGVIAYDGASWSLGDLRRTPIPALVQQVIDNRLARIDQVNRRLLSVAATIGQDVKLDIWQQVSAADDSRLALTVRDATGLNILQEAPTPGTMQFTHALFREVLYHEIPLPERRLLHTAIAEAYEGQLKTEPDAISYHFQQAQNERSLEWLMIAGERAQQLYAWRTAAERFSTVLDLIGANSQLTCVRGWLAYRIGLLLTYADSATGIRRLEEAEHLAEATADDQLRAYARADRGLLRCLTGDVKRGLAEMRSGVAAIDTLKPAVVEGDTLTSGHLSVGSIRRGALRLVSSADSINVRRGALVFWLAWAGRYDDAISIGETFVEEASHVATNLQDAIGDALAGLGHAYAALGRPDESLNAFARARDAFSAIDHHFKVGNTAIYELSEAFLPYRADRIMEREWLADQAEAG